MGLGVINKLMCDQRDVTPGDISPINVLWLQYILYYVESVNTNYRYLHLEPSVIFILFFHKNIQCPGVLMSECASLVPPALTRP